MSEEPSRLRPSELALAKTTASGDAVDAPSYSLKRQYRALLALLAPVLLSASFHEAVFPSASAALGGGASDVLNRPGSPDDGAVQNFDWAQFLVDDASDDGSSDEGVAGAPRLELHDKSTGNAYRVLNEEGTTVAMYKPGRDAAAREYVASRLAPDLVPETARFDLPGRGVGSLQRFVEDAEDGEDYGPGVFSTAAVQKLAVLDMRILNLDRHTGNVLLLGDRGERDLLAIDHELSLPRLDELSRVTFCWRTWKQVQAPLVAEVAAQIGAIEVLKDLRLMNEAGLTVEHQLATFASSALLKLGVARGLRLGEIGSLMEREGDRSRPSALEECIAEAVANTLTSAAWRARHREPSLGIALEFAAAFREAAEMAVRDVVLARD